VVLAKQETPSHVFPVSPLAVILMVGLDAVKLAVLASQSRQLAFLIPRLLLCALSSRTFTLFAGTFLIKLPTDEIKLCLNSYQ
jgi:hypothetical protein